MTDLNTETSSTEISTDSGRFSLIEVFATVVKWRKFIIGVVLVVTLLSAAVSFLLPKWYAARTSIMPPRSRGALTGLGDISRLQREIPLLRGLAGGGGTEDIYRYLAILKSRKGLEKVVTKFNLVEVYEVEEKSIAEAVETLRENCIFKLGEEGAIEITVYDRDPQRAAAMANYFVEVINEVWIDLNAQEARSSREFLEKNVNEIQLNLEAAEERLRNFQKKEGFVSIPQETQATISAAAELFARKMLVEVEMGIAERRFGAANPLVKAAETELATLNAKLRTLPDLGVEYLRLYRDFAVQQKIYEYIVPLYEQAKYEERRDVASAVVLDVAQVPEKPARPKKKLIVLIFAFIATASSIAVALLAESLESMKLGNPERYSKLERAWAAVRPVFRRRKRS